MLNNKFKRTESKLNRMILSTDNIQHKQIIGLLITKWNKGELPPPLFLKLESDKLVKDILSHTQSENQPLESYWMSLRGIIERG